jgi:hypothetical protein
MRIARVVKRNVSRIRRHGFFEPTAKKSPPSDDHAAKESCMKVLLLVASLAACTDYRSMTMKVTGNVPRTSGVVSALQVPDRCPIYTPNGSDIDTPELPYDAPLLFGCAVDGEGETYGIVTGDTGDLAIVSGEREVGLYIAFDKTVQDEPLTAQHLGLDGPSPLIKVYSAPYNTYGQLPDHCCAEDSETARIPVKLVAVGAAGMLLSFGHADASATQIAIVWDNRQLFPGHDFRFSNLYTDRFYVNGPP